MNSTRRTLLPRLLMIALSTLGFTAAFANAQASQGKFRLPVEAHWGLAVLPPGDYTFTLDHATANGMIIVRGQGKAAIIPATAGISLSKITEQSELVLVNRAGHSTVRSMYLGHLGLTLQYHVPKDETRYVSQSAPSRSVPVTTASR